MNIFRDWIIPGCLFAAGVMMTIGCTSDRWRAKTLDSVSNEASQVFKVNEQTFGNGLEVQKFRLSNGLKVILHEDHSAPLFAYHTWFNVGSRNEREGITGIAHLFEHLLFKETKNLKEGEFDKLIESQGGSVNAATYLDWTFFRQTVPAEAFEMIPRLEADRMQNMILNDKQVNSEREVVANERRFRVDNSPGGAMYELLYKTAYTKHPYYWPVIGWMRDIESISTEDCIQFYQTYYAPNNATIVVVGDVTREQVLKAIQKYYGSISASTIPKQSFPKEPEQKKERRVEVEKPIPVEKMMAGYHVPDALHEDVPALEVAHAVLFNGRSSRLYRRLVAELQIATDAGGWVSQLKDPGLYVMDVTMQPGKKIGEAENVIDEEIVRLAKEPVPEKELEKAKNRLETSFWGNFRTVDHKAQAFGFYETTLGDYRKIFDEVESYRRVTAADVMRVAKTYFRPENRSVIVARPKGN